MEELKPRLMGIDFGDSRIGVALSDPLGIMATPLNIINRTAEADDIAALVDIIHRNGVGRVVMGLPVSMNGTLGQQAEKVRAFAAELGKKIDIPVEFRDERLSTVTAKNLLQEARKTDRKTRYDAAAAALILQSYLDDIAGLPALPDEPET